MVELFESSHFVQYCQRLSPSPSIPSIPDYIGVVIAVIQGGRIYDSGH